MAARIAVLASGGGTNLQAIIDYYAAITLQGEAAGSIELVASNRANAGALDRARAAGIPAETFDATDDGTALGNLLEKFSIDLVVLAGYLKHIPAADHQAYHGRGSSTFIRVCCPISAAPGCTARAFTPPFSHPVRPAPDSRCISLTMSTITGPVIAQWRVRVKIDDTARNARRPRSLRRAHRLSASGGHGRRVERRRPDGGFLECRSLFFPSPTRLDSSSSPKD